MAAELAELSARVDLLAGQVQRMGEEVGKRGLTTDVAQLRQTQTQQ